MLTHYNYQFDVGSNSFHFTTKNFISYKISFIIDETFSSLSEEEIPNIYQIVVEKITNKTEPFDNKVAKTIEHIIQQFFRFNENTIIYICSNSDNKERKRFKVFNRWYENSNQKNFIKKIDYVFSFEENINERTEIFTSLIYHIDNPNLTKILKIYNSIESLLNEEK